MSIVGEYLIGLIAKVSGDIVERVDPEFFSDPIMAAMKALGLT